jgi:site-specific recombinase XerD
VATSKAIILLLAGDASTDRARQEFVHKVGDRIRVKAGLPHLRIHDLRDQHASFLLNSGRSLHEVLKILGHSSRSATQRYAHLRSKSLMDTAYPYAKALV